MTEKEWLACEDPMPMLEFLRGKASHRKLLLFAMSCCRSNWTRINEPHRKLIQVLERFAEDEATKEELDMAWDACGGEQNNSAFRAVRAAASNASRPRGLGYVFGVEYVARTAVRANNEIAQANAQRMTQSKWVRDIMGNPFHSIIINSAWLTPTVLFLAQASYANQNQLSGTLDNARLPILADALEEAGCSNADILNHLRSPGPHVRGCFGLDLLLGKE